MVAAFISHSRNDVELVNRVFTALNQAGITPKIAEFEELGEKGGLTASQIKEMMANSSWTLLFLTPNVVASLRTRNWVTYEVGVSHGLGKPVWVFEDEKNPMRDFHVPYLDYYFLYDPKNSQDWSVIKEEIAKYARLPELGPAIVGAILGAPFGKPGALIGALLGLAKSRADLEELRARAPHGFYKVKVSCERCNGFYTILAKFNVIISPFTCPICRETISLR